jgi:uncharacterized radical SAM superfamily Fe-S cluster-containing enzyme
VAPRRAPGFTVCSYNSGPYFREKVEREFSVSFDLKAAKQNGNGLVNIA